jgi:hypothetical protein
MAAEDRSPDLTRMALAAEARMKELLLELQQRAAVCDPIQLLSSLTLRHQVLDRQTKTDYDEFASWQVRLEFLAWLLASAASGCGEDATGPPPQAQLTPETVDRVEETLQEYFQAASLAILRDDPDLDRESNSLRALLRTEALHVRGEGPPALVRYLAAELYGPHHGWFHRTLGFDVGEAIAVVEAVNHVIGSRISEWLTRTSLSDASANSNAGRFRSITEPAVLLSFQRQDVVRVLPEIDPQRVTRCLERLSARFGSLDGPPELLAFNPLARTPILTSGSDHFLFVPPLLYDSLLNSFHFDLLADDAYRPTYTTVRATWLEHVAMEGLRHVWPGALTGVNLKYGPKKKRAEIDAVVFHDGFLLLVECKWKSITMLARAGILEALHTDAKQALHDAVDQAARARRYVETCGTEVRFSNPSGPDVVIQRDQINEVFLVGITGRGGLSILAANPTVAKPLGLLQWTPPPWMLSLTDLMTVCAAIEFPGQLVDFIRRRSDVVLDGRFHVHDEWDWLDLYFAGRLDVYDAEFAQYDSVSFTTSGQALERVLLSGGADRPPEVQRKLHARMRRLLQWLEESGQPGRTDLVATILGLSDRQLMEIAELWIATESRSLADGKTHDASGVAKRRNAGFTILTGASVFDDLANRMAVLSTMKKYELRAESWFGIASDIRAPNGPYAVFFDQSPWQPDPQLDGIIKSRRSGNSSA